MSADQTDDGVVQIDDPRWSGYLANLTPEEFDRDFASRLPETMRGEDFLKRYGGTTDKITRVDPSADLRGSPADGPSHSRARAGAAIRGDALGSH